jgi:alginate O-acetyltransferase complex protein AlgI
MQFNSPIFLFLYLPITLALFFITPTRWRWVLLLIVSIWFYAWGDVTALPLIALSILINYVLGLLMGYVRNHRSLILFLAVAFNVGLLGYVKYADFILSNLGWLLTILKITPTDSPLGSILPLGISLITFHHLSYMIDVYRGKKRPEKNLFRFAHYILFFPKLIAGPITRFSIKNLSTAHSQGEMINDITYGTRRFIEGLAKKVLIASPLSTVVSGIFSQTPADLTGASIWYGAILYTLEIYIDFSAYSDMAIGIARIFGIRLPENFNYPYRAQSITDFWRRWHITLSQWFRDYLYIPLGGNRQGKVRTMINLVVVFLLCGLWHGANWTFVVWGLWHGVLLIFERLGGNTVLARLPIGLRHLYVMTGVLIGWVFFRSPSVAYAGFMLQKMLSLDAITTAATFLIKPLYLFALILGIVYVSGIHETLVKKWYRYSPSYIVSIALFLMAILSIVINTYKPFIYAQF